MEKFFNTNKYIYILKKYIFCDGVLGFQRRILLRQLTKEFYLVLFTKQKNKKPSKFLNKCIFFKSIELSICF